MCGIAGFFAADRQATVDEALVRAMGKTLTHRGPDGAGLRVRPGYGLAHQRLAIVDLAGGEQPMGDADGRVWVTYNGEVYNFLELRAELEQLGYRFSTRCDTEVLVNGYREWGERLPERLRGMFAFAIVDEKEHTLFAARDRVGKKPFYYALLGGDLVFGSELKALLEHPNLRRRIDPVALSQFFCLRYVPDPRTIFEGVSKLPPGHSMTVRDGRATLRRYWQLSFATQVRRSPSDLADEMLELLDDAVRVRLMSDVPLGAFLSGGVDSFAVVESMSRVGTGDVVACTMGLEGDPTDERPHARKAAEFCGAVLHEGCISAEDLLEQSWFDYAFDEPFGDSSAVPTYHVSRLARQHVTVALSGDGGDESFAGYRRYKYDVVENRVRAWLPRVLWRGLGAIYPKLDFLPRYLRFKATLQNLALSPARAYARSVSAVHPEMLQSLLRPDLREAAVDPLEPIVAAYDAADGPDPLSRLIATDFATFLPGDILTKVDRASMAVSLEVRAPLLDHQIVEAAAAIPSAIKMAGGTAKAFLRDALARRLPEDAMRREKRGFHVPEGKWMRGAPGDALEAALSSDSLREWIDTEVLRRILEQHRTGMRNHSGVLWNALVLYRFQQRWL